MIENEMIHFILGTKAQYIKTAPLMRKMEELGIEYNLIDTGQHAEFSKKLRSELRVKAPDSYLFDKGNIKTIREALLWILKSIHIYIFRRKYIKKNVFKGKRGICIIHGDTPSTLIGLALARRCGLKVAHIEAGLRSFNFIKPFPEEIIRVVCMKFSHYLFAPSRLAYENAKKINKHGKIIDIKQNTNVEAMYFSLKETEIKEIFPENYCVITIHRVETIFSKKRLKFIVDKIVELSRIQKVIFVMHEPTQKKLNDFKLMSCVLAAENLEVISLTGHAQFLKLLKSSNFVVTDGGSIQEECFYLDIPCLVMRTETERQEGIGQNVMISNFNNDEFNNFIANFSRFKSGKIVDNMKPSEIILLHINQL